MRLGMSWPAGHGRREWISMGPLGWLLLGPFIFAVWAALVIVVLAVWLVIAGARGAAWLARWLASRPAWRSRA